MEWSMQTWGRQGAQKVAARLVWGDRSEKISWRQDQFQGHTPVSQVLTLRSAHAWGLMLCGPLLTFLTPWLHLWHVCSVWRTRGHTPGAWRPSPVQSHLLPPCLPRRGSQQPTFRRWGQAAPPGRERPACCRHPPSPAETRHGSKAGLVLHCVLGGARWHLFPAWVGSSIVLSRQLMEASLLPSMRFQIFPVQRVQFLGLGGQMCDDWLAHFFILHWAQKIMWSACLGVMMLGLILEG